MPGAGLPSGKSEQVRIAVFAHSPVHALIDLIVRCRLCRPIPVGCPIRLDLRLDVHPVIRFMLKTKTVGARALPEGIEVTFAPAEEGGTAPTPQVYDLVLQAVGRTPNGKKIAADKAGVAVTDRGFINPDCPLAPFALSLSKGREGFDKLSPNGIFPMDNLGSTLISKCAPTRSPRPRQDPGRRHGRHARGRHDWRSGSGH